MLKKCLEELILSFNQPNTILVISKYPYQNEGLSFHGVAVYTKNTLEAICQRTSQKFVVLVQKEYLRQPELLANGQILVLPVFGASKWQMFVELQKTIKKFSLIKNIQIHSEFYNSGDLLQMSLLLPFLYQLRLRGKCIGYVAHNVVDDLSFLAKHLFKNKESLKLKFLTFLVPFYYQLLSFGVNQLITLDQAIQKRLQNYLLKSVKVKNTNIWLSPKKITKQSISKNRCALGIGDKDLVLAVYGFMSLYKGVDKLIAHFEHFKKENPNYKIKLLLAGGPAPSKINDLNYQSFYSNLEKKAEQNKDIILTGFISEKNLDKFYSVADLAILPYRGILGASASLASVLSYGKAFLLSPQLEDYLKVGDIQSLAKKNKLNLKQLILKRNYQPFAKFLLDLNKNPSKLKEIAKFSQELAKLRSEDNCVFRDFPPLYFPQLPVEERDLVLALAKNEH